MNTIPLSFPSQNISKCSFIKDGELKNCVNKVDQKTGDSAQKLCQLKACDSQSLHVMFVTEKMPQHTPK